MSAVFSVIHATRGRPNKAVESMLRWIQRAVNPELVEYIFACSPDDVVATQGLCNLAESAEVRHATDRLHGFRIIGTQSPGSAGAWNEAAIVSAGQLIIQAQDDVEPPDEWDMELHLRLPNDWSDKFIFVCVSDGYRKDALCCTAIMTRKRMQQEGFFIFPGYLSVFSDDEVTYRAIRDSQAGECKLVNARGLIFRHEHHYHNPGVPWDETYARENSAEAYEVGRKLFFERNPKAATDGIRSWK